MTLPIHFDDYDVFLSPIADLNREMMLASGSHQEQIEKGDEGDAATEGTEEGGQEVIWWERGDRFEFGVQ